MILPEDKFFDEHFYRLREDCLAKYENTNKEGGENMPEPEGQYQKPLNAPIKPLTSPEASSNPKSSGEPTPPQTVEELRKEVEGLKKSIVALDAEIDCERKITVDLQKELTRLRAENAWVAVTPETMPTKEDADRNGNVQWLYPNPFCTDFKPWNWDRFDSRHCTHWRRTNLPTLPAPIVEDEFEKWLRDQNIQWTNDPQRDENIRQGARIVWVAKTSTGGKP
jgi:hypothetical protein